jgi:predicted transcriptional regulator
LGKSKTISLRVEEELFDFISENAQKFDISKSQFIIKAILNNNVQVDTKKKDRLKILYNLNDIKQKIDNIASRCNMSKAIDIAILEELILLEKYIAECINDN